MSDDGHFTIREPKHATAATGDEEAVLHRLWKLATIEVVNAQRDYASLEGCSGDIDSLVAAAWLRLWQAENQQRQLATQIKSLRQQRPKVRPLLRV